MSTLVSFKNLLIKFKRIIADRLQNVFVLALSNLAPTVYGSVIKTMFHSE